MPASHLTAKNRIKFHEGGAAWQHRAFHGMTVVGRRHRVGGTHASTCSRHLAPAMEVEDGLARRQMYGRSCSPSHFFFRCDFMVIQSEFTFSEFIQPLHMVNSLISEFAAVSEIRVKSPSCEISMISLQ